MNQHREEVKELINSFKEEEYFDFVNLHIHSKYSDGNAEFDDIIRQARDLGFRKIAICDHNTVEGHKQYRDSILLPAVEFDCWYGYVFMHLLAYGIDVENPKLTKFMAKTKQGTEADIVRIFARRNVKKLIDAIHQAGGIAVLAHPACCWAINLDKFVAKLIDIGLDGIEVYYPYQRHRKIFKFHTTEKVMEIADKYNLVKTGGTDCHTRNIL
ncbi:MAG: PHP domain-containing protein [Cyanobacteria bacterium RUI128]|nr:PHP domain-containing protein [Cyanobacteria bacterium RUI128]